MATHNSIDPLSMPGFGANVYSTYSGGQSLCRRRAQSSAEYHNDKEYGISRARSRIVKDGIKSYLNAASLANRGLHAIGSYKPPRFQRAWLVVYDKMICKNNSKNNGKREAKGNATVENVIDRMGMNWDENQRQEYINSIKVVELKRLVVPYPTDDYYMATTSAAKDQWERYWYERGTKDKRMHGGKRRTIKLLDESQLQYTIPQNESVIFRDADTKEIFMIILRDFIPDAKIRADMVNTCRWILKYRRDDRRDDPGQLVHFGYTCGSRHEPSCKLAANRRYISPKEHQKLNNDSQGMAGIGWNMLRSRMPQFIINDYNETIKKIPGCPRMDMEETKGVKNNLFTYKVNGSPLTFNEKDDLELPPPSGLSAVNYARFTHRENNGNEWFIAVTCLAAEDPTIGGNFYNASYGIMMEAASNTVSAFRPNDYHGTTLYEIVVPEGNYDPTDKRWPVDGREFRPDGGENIGFAFEVSRNLMYAKRRRTELEVTTPPAKETTKRARRAKYRAAPLSDHESDSDFEP